MNWQSWLILGWFVVLTVVQLWILVRLVRAFRTTSVPAVDSGVYPPALIVLCLRGTDPFLRDCLSRLSSMDYPNYRLRLVIDSENDPVVPEISAFLASSPRVPVDIRFLQKRLPHCSGKICGMLRATEDLDPEFKFVGFFDGDALVHPSCLRELIAPLIADAGIGVTSGNRWYSPRTNDLPTLMRANWNAYAMGVMNVISSPWGGCMALRAEDVKDSDFRRTLEFAFGEDNTIAMYMLDRDRRVRFVSDASIINPEEISLRGLYNFLVRQIVIARLHNHYWIWIFLHNVTLNVSLLLGLFLAVIPSIRIATVVGYSLLLLVAMLEPMVAFLLVERSVSKRNIHLPLPTWRQLIWLPVFAVGTNIFSLLSTVHAAFVQRHLWRGITYRFGGEHAATILNVAPMKPAASSGT